MVDLESHPVFAQLVRPRLFFVALTVVSLFSLCLVFYLQIFQGIPPCILCLYQRVPYYLVMGIALIGVLITRDSTYDSVANILALLCGFAFLAGSVIALFHVGVENTWWQGTTSCGGSGFQATDFQDLKKEIMKAPIANCREILWQHWGISLAAWNLLWSTFLTLITATFTTIRLYNKRT